MAGVGLQHDGTLGHATSRGQWGLVHKTIEAPVREGRSVVAPDRTTLLRSLRRARVVLVALVLALASVSPAWAAPKKEEAAATKSYVLPYIIVLGVIGLSLMTICRPSRRKDKPDDRKLDDED